MVTRREIIVSVGGSGTLLPGCLYLSSDGNKPSGCPGHPRSKAAFCSDNRKSDITLSKHQTSDSMENSFLLRLTTQSPIALDPSAYAYFSENDGDWELEAAIDPARSEQIRLGSGQQLDWWVTFERDPEVSEEENSISLAPHRPDIWNALSIPVWQNEGIESQTFIFSRDHL